MSKGNAVGLCLLLGVLAGGAVRADEVNLSRVVYRASTGEGLVEIEAGTVAKFCGDTDGCEIVGRLEKAAEARTVTARLFVNAGAETRWFTSTSATGAYYYDGDGPINRVFLLAAGTNNCIMDDGAAFDPGLDEYLGFELGVGGADPATCTIVISD